MRLKVSLDGAEIVAACTYYIEEKMMLHGPGWRIECENDYAARQLEFTVEAPPAKEPDDEA